MKLTVLEDSSDEQLMLGEKQNNGEFDWFPVIRVEYPRDNWGDNATDTYYVSLMAVGRDEANKGEGWAAARRVLGCETRGTEGWAREAEVQGVVPGGIGAPVGQ